MNNKKRFSVISKEMSLTHRDFFLTLPRLLKDTPYTYSNHIVSFQVNGKHVEIQLAPEKIRKLSSTVSLPFTRIEIKCYEFSPKESEDFIHDFNLRFLRGGGWRKSQRYNIPEQTIETITREQSILKEEIMTLPSHFFAHLTKKCSGRTNIRTCQGKYGRFRNNR